MAALTTSRLINPLPVKGWAKVPAPLYHAVELPDQAGVYSCTAFGPQLVSASTLLAWAVEAGVEVALVEWVRPQEVA